jgi:hypothetical protein
MTGYNLPDGLGVGELNRYLDGPDDAEVLRQEIHELLDESCSCFLDLQNNLISLESLAKDKFYLNVRRKDDNGPRTHDRFESLKLLAEDLESWLLDITPEEE